MTEIKNRVAPFVASVNHQVKQNVIYPPGSECVIWVGEMIYGHPTAIANQEMPDGTSRRRLRNVKRWVMHDTDSVIPAHTPVYRTSCGVGRRCITPEHQVLKHQVPNSEWNETNRKMAESK